MLTYPGNLGILIFGFDLIFSTVQFRQFCQTKVAKKLAELGIKTHYSSKVNCGLSRNELALKLLIGKELKRRKHEKLVSRITHFTQKSQKMFLKKFRNFFFQVSGRLFFSFWFVSLEVEICFEKEPFKKVGQDFRKEEKVK